MEEATRHRARRSGRRLSALVAAAAVAPLLALVGLVAARATDVPTWDEWDTPGLALVAHREGRLAWSDLWSQHNESRKVLPRLVAIALARDGSWDTRQGMGLAVVWAVLLSAGVLALSNRTLRLPLVDRLALWTGANLLLFSPAQFDNWLLGLGWVVFVPATCLVWSLVVLWSGSVTPRRVLCVGGLALLASLTFSGGLLPWGILAAAIAVAPGAGAGLARSRARLLSVWIVAAAGFAAAYFLGYQRPAHHPSLSANLADAGAFGRHVAAFLGSALAFGRVRVAEALGLAGIGAFLALVVLGLPRSHRSVPAASSPRTQVGAAAPWALLALLGIGEALLVALGRASLGEGQAIASRYTTHAAVFAVALAHGAAAAHAERRPAWRPMGSRRSLAALGGGLLAFLALSGASWLVGARAMANYERDRLEGKACLRLLSVAEEPVCLETRVYPSVARLEEMAAAVAGVGLLRPPPARTAAEVLDEDASAPTPRGGIEWTENDGDTWRVGGTARRAAGGPADAVLVVARCRSGESRIVAVGRVGNRSYGFLEALGIVPDRNDRWAVAFDADRMPACRAELEAWALHTATGRARLLAAP